MIAYCFDTSGITNPLETTPEDIHKSLWMQFCNCIEAGKIAVTQEIYDEMCNIRGIVGDCIAASKNKLVFEVLEDKWDWETYIEHIKRMQKDYEGCLSENKGNISSTICKNDLTIIALAKTLKLPVVSMEAKLTLSGGTYKRRIPNICETENVEHLRFNDFLRKEKFNF